MTSIALFGAGGKMGCRITDNLRDNPAYSMRYIEVGQQGLANLAGRGLAATPAEAAIPQADVVILALPDSRIGHVTHEIVPQLRPGTLVIGLDPAAAYAGVMPERPDISYFVAHPCHPPVFSDETSPEAMHDYFGGQFAAQDIVCALYRGPDEDYAKGEAIARAMYRPVKQAHRVTVEQMAILEPALVETTALTCILAMREAMDAAIEMGVPEAAARAFMMGHVRVLLAIVFDYAGFPVSDGAKLAAEEARSKLFQPDWKEKIMNIDSIRASVQAITHPQR
jgi:hypothetical protein